MMFDDKSGLLKKIDARQEIIELFFHLVLAISFCSDNIFLIWNLIDPAVLSILQDQDHPHLCKLHSHMDFCRIINLILL